MGIEFKMKINTEQFKKDFNENNLTNSDLLKKYPFKNMNDCIQYARDNNLIDKPKPLTKEEKENWDKISKFLENPFK